MASRVAGAWPSLASAPAAQHGGFVRGRFVLAPPQRRPQSDAQSGGGTSRAARTPNIALAQPSLLRVRPIDVTVMSSIGGPLSLTDPRRKSLRPSGPRVGCRGGNAPEGPRVPLWPGPSIAAAATLGCERE